MITERGAQRNNFDKRSIWPLMLSILGETKAADFDVAATTTQSRLRQIHSKATD
jgi:hypothetical protein